MSIDYIFLTQINILSYTFVYCFTGAIFCNTNKRFNKTFKIKQMISTHVTDVVKFVSKYHTMMLGPLRLLVNRILYIDWQTRMGALGGGCLLLGGGVVPQHALRQRPPGRDGYCCGRYASYWNAFLFDGSSTMY